MKGNELRSLINMVSKGKPYIPILFVTGGLNKLTQFNLAEDYMGYNMEEKDSVDSDMGFDNREKLAEALDKDFIAIEKDPADVEKIDDEAAITRKKGVMKLTTKEKLLQMYSKKMTPPKEFDSVLVDTNKEMVPDVRIQY